MSCDVKVGNNIPLSVQVECPDTTMVFVRAFIYDQNDNQLSTRDLIDRGDGRFENFSYTMPNLDFVSVQYIAYDDATYTNRLDEPCPATEVFKRLEEVGGGADSPVAGIQAVGKIVSATIQGKVFGSKIIKGYVSGATLKGRINSNPTISGKIISPFIQGRIVCKK